MQETPLLMTMQRNVGRVQIEHDPRRCLGIGFQQQIHQQTIDRFLRVADLVSARASRIRARQLHPVQRALAGQRRVQIALARQHAQQRIVTQRLVVVQILVSQRQTVDALGYHLGQRVLHPRRIAAVQKTTGEPAPQPEAVVHLAQQ